MEPPPPGGSTEEKSPNLMPSETTAEEALIEEPPRCRAPPRSDRGPSPSRPAGRASTPPAGLRPGYDVAGRVPGPTPAGARPARCQGPAERDGAPARPARLRRHPGHRHRRLPSELALQAGDARGVVLRRPQHRRGEHLGRVLHPGRGLRRTAPADAGVVGDDPPLRPVPGRGRQEDDVGLRPVGHAHAGHRPPVQSRRLLVRRPGRDGQPPHEPVPLRALRAGQQLLHRPGRPPVGQCPGALWAAVPPDRRVLHPDHLPQRAGHHRPAPPAVPGRACC